MQPPPRGGARADASCSAASFLRREVGAFVVTLVAIHRWSGTECRHRFRNAAASGLCCPEQFLRALAKREWTPPSTTRPTDHAVHQPLQVTATIRKNAFWMNCKADTGALELSQFKTQLRAMTFSNAYALQKSATAKRQKVWLMRLRKTIRCSGERFCGYTG